MVDCAEEGRMVGSSTCLPLFCCRSAFALGCGAAREVAPGKRPDMMAAVAKLSMSEREPIRPVAGEGARGVVFLNRVEMGETYCACSCERRAGGACTAGGARESSMHVC